MTQTTRMMTIALGVLATTACLRSAHASLARVAVSLEAGPVSELLVPSSPTPTGNQKFNLSIMADGLSVTWDYAADLDPAGNSIINGSTTFINMTTKTIAVRAEFSAPLCPPIAGGSQIGGVASVKMISNADGGLVACASDEKELDVALISGAPELPLFWCPFELSMSGSGTATTSTTFGAPVPSLPGPAIIADLGHAVTLSISPGDKVVMTLIYLAKGEFQKIDESTCEGDANHDRVVDGGDLAMVVNHFDSLANCGESADVNGDGFVDGADLAELLSHWGACADPK